MIATFRWICWLLWLALQALPWGAAAATPGNSQTVRIGTVAIRSVSQTLARWQPLAIALQRALPDYDFVIEAYDIAGVTAAVQNQQVDFVLISPGLYIQVSRHGALSSPLATLVGSEGGHPLSAIGGVIFSAANRGDIAGLADLKGKTVGTVDKDSFGGFQIQVYELLRAGVAPTNTRVIATGTPHDRVVEAVLAGTVDAGFVRSGVLEAMVHEGKLDLARIKIINRQELPNFPQQLSTRLYPEWGFAALPQVDPNLARRVTAALFQFPETDPAGLRAMEISGFTIPADYSPVEDLLRNLNLPPFDAAPLFTVQDVWERYQWMVVAILLVAALVALLTYRLLASNRKLVAEHDIVVQHSDALQRSNTDLEQFAYSVSHDMRQPLRSVTGHLQLLARGLKDQLDEDNRENLEFALDGAKRMDAMIVSLLDYSRVGRKTETKQWLNSRQPLDEALGYLEVPIQEAQAQVVVNGDWPRVFASRDELTRLFQNLIDNALKYREPGTVPRVDVSVSVSSRHWQVMVRDQGIGIDPQQASRLFQFFSRLQSRSRFEGTGMGLALCRRIVEHHRGRIWVESAGPGLGSTFFFELPLHETFDKESDA